MRLYIYFLDFLARLSAFQRRIGWNRVDYILLFLTVCWGSLVLLSNCYEQEIWSPIFQGVILTSVWLAQIFGKYVRNWRSSKVQA